MVLTEKELEHLAQLSKLELTQEEKTKLLKGLESIVTFLGELKNTGSETPEEGTKRLSPFREQSTFEAPELLLKNSQNLKDGFVSVKTSL
ncbi:MAG: hypothetical protein DLD55_00185 [candidate division SR1 bacterium]|nr:MAG: hypothetical protein DLD55_00185 [candidate division SR1 bacterium]